MNNLLNFSALHSLLGFGAAGNESPATPCINSGNAYQRVEGVTPGCYSLQLTDTQYHREFKQASSSAIKKLLRSPAHYKAYLNSADSDSSARKFGRAVHALLLEPHVFDDSFAIWTDGRRQGLKYEDFVYRNPGKTILNEDEFHRATEAALSLRNTSLFPLKLWLEGVPASGELAQIDPAKTEFTIFWTDEETGIECKARIDAHNRLPNPIAFDVKTTDDSRTDSYMYQFFKLDYDLQAAHYTAALKAFYGVDFPFFHAVVEDDDPYATNVIAIDADVLANGEAKRRDALRILKKSTDEDHWPAYNYSGIQVMELPFFKRYEPKTKALTDLSA